MKIKGILAFVVLVMIDLVIIYFLMPEKLTQNLNVTKLILLYGFLFLVLVGLHVLLDKSKQKRQLRISQRQKEQQNEE